MLKCASVFTLEIDSIEGAVADIKSQLEEKLPLLEHSIGIVMCHPEFIASGILKHLRENLTFELVGTTTSSQSTNDQADEHVLTIFVMTSDDVQFVAGVTDSVIESVELPVQNAYKKISADVQGLPKLVLTFPPLILKYSGEVYIRAWEQAIPNVPIFGSIAIDDTLTFQDSQTIFNGNSFYGSMPFVLCYGNISPRFIVGTLPLDKAMPYKCTVTKSAGPFVYEINDKNAYQYFEDIGLAHNAALTDNYLFVPFVIDQKNRQDYDNIPVIRAHASFTSDGVAIFRGEVDEGSTMSMLSANAKDVLETTKEKAEQLIGLDNAAGALLFPCIIRQMITMRPNPIGELELVRNIIGSSLPFMMGYSGGEICPTSIRDGVPVNRFHNHSLIILVV